MDDPSCARCLKMSLERVKNNRHHGGNKPAIPFDRNFAAAKSYLYLSIHIRRIL